VLSTKIAFIALPSV